MPTRKIADLDPQDACTHREHNPPNHMVYSPGIYEHTCPRCGRTTTFTVRGAVYYWKGDNKVNLFRPMTSEERVSFAAGEFGQAGGKARSKQRRWSTTPKERSEQARKAANTRWANR